MLPSAPKSIIFFFNWKNTIFISVSQMNVGPKQIGLVQNRIYQERMPDAQMLAGMQVSWRAFIQIFAGESGKRADLYDWLLLMPDFLFWSQSASLSAVPLTEAIFLGFTGRSSTLHCYFLRFTCHPFNDAIKTAVDLGGRSRNWPQAKNDS